MYGRFVSHELRVRDVDAAAAFYGDLLGWEFTDHPMGKSITCDGTPIGGASPVKPGVPDHWAACVAVPDVDAAASAARTAGGIVTTGDPVDIPGTGRLAPILDPAKSIFLTLTPAPGTPAPGFPQSAAPATGHFIWHRLRTPDAQQAAAFYREVLGWTTVPSPDGTAAIAHLADGTRVAELITTTDAAGWLPFVLVPSADTARTRAESLGATTTDPVDIPGVGRFTVITDPQGAELAVHEAR